MVTMSGTKVDLANKDIFMDTREGSVHIEDDRVQNMINDVVSDLVNSDKDEDAAFCLSGDALVVGFRCIDDYIDYDDEGKFEEGKGEIDIFVVQHYKHAVLSTKDYGVTWKVSKWDESCEEDELTEQEKIDKLEQDIEKMKVILDSMRDVYNPHREV